MRYPLVRFGFFIAIFSAVLFTASGYAGARIIVNPDVDVDMLSKNAASAIFGMRLRVWSDGQPIKVYVLGDRHPTHIDVAKKILAIFPHQLRRAWDRQVFSGTGQAPIKVDTEIEMRSAVATTPGAIGYLSDQMVDDTVRVVGVK